jgi:hypothetical protein
MRQQLGMAKAAARARRLPIATARVRERNKEFWRLLDLARAAHEQLVDECTACDALLGQRTFTDGELYWPELCNEPAVRTETMTIGGRESILEFRRRRLTFTGWLK